MQSWPQPHLPALPDLDLPPLRLYDTADDAVKPVGNQQQVTMYACGITPYDSTHLGHAATYVACDLINRYLRAAGHDVLFVENVTDVDDPLFERAQRDGVDWRELGQQQTALFRSDMEDLAVIPPQDFVAATETVGEVVDLVQRLLEVGAAYQVEEDEFPDVYADHRFTPQFGYESRYDTDTMAELFAERGGDPQRPGKRHPLDALLWRAHRPAEPEWDAPFGSGRPGWHVECAAIAQRRLGNSFTIQAGGADLRFPHHEFSAAHVEAATGCERMAQHYVHTGMIGFEGTKMSKSLGNLVFVSDLTAAGHEPSAIRLGLYAGHYRADRDWSEEVLNAAEHRLAMWRAAAAANTDADAAAATAAELATGLAEDLDTPSALQAVDRWAESVVGGRTPLTGVQEGNRPAVASKILVATLDALLAVRL